MLNQNLSNQSFYNPNSKNLFNYFNKLQLFFDKGAILLDVRTIQEFGRCHLPNARHIDCDQLSVLLAYVKGWEMPIITYSGYGGRSRLATQLLQSTNIKTLDGGAKNTLEFLFFKKKDKVSSSLLT
ncbi:MAG: rhodanese-like domain-containing protein [Saprospiraceae bacterium]